MPASKFKFHNHTVEFNIVPFQTGATDAETIRTYITFLIISNKHLYLWADLLA